MPGDLLCVRDGLLAGPQSPSCLRDLGGDADQWWQISRWRHDGAVGVVRYHIEGSAGTIRGQCEIRYAPPSRCSYAWDSGVEFAVANVPGASSDVFQVGTDATVRITVEPSHCQATCLSPVVISRGTFEFAVGPIAPPEWA